MTHKYNFTEKKLLKYAKRIVLKCRLKEYGLQDTPIYISGSLSLKHQGYNLQREAHDIDLVVMGNKSERISESLIEIIQSFDDVDTFRKIERDGENNENKNIYHDSLKFEVYMKYERYTIDVLFNNDNYKPVDK